MNRVATYRELDHDLHKHAAFLTLVSCIGIKNKMTENSYNLSLNEDTVLIYASITDKKFSIIIKTPSFYAV